MTDGVTVPERRRTRILLARLRAAWDVQRLAEMAVHWHLDGLIKLSLRQTRLSVQTSQSANRYLLSRKEEFNEM